MNLLTLYVLSGRISLLLFGLSSIWVGIWFGFIVDRLPQNEKLLRIMPSSRRERLRIFVLSIGFGALLIVMGLKASPAAFNAPFGDIVACSSPFWIAGAVAVVRTTIVELRQANRLRRQLNVERPAITDSSEQTWTEH